MSVYLNGRYFSLRSSSVSRNRAGAMTSLHYIDHLVDLIDGGLPDIVPHLSLPMPQLVFADSVSTISLVSLAIFTHVVIHHRFCAALNSQVTWLLTLHARGDDQWAFQHSQLREALQWELEEPGVVLCHVSTLDSLGFACQTHLPQIEIC
jgi:hypothetical protein